MPPKTTEWIAPIRTHAGIAIAASGIIGKYDDYARSTSDAQFSQRRRKPANLRVQLTERIL